MPGLEEDPLDRYQRDPLPATRLGDDAEVRHGPTEPQFEDVPDYDAQPLPPVEDDAEDGVPASAGLGSAPPASAGLGSTPPPDAFSAEPNLFGPPRGTFKLPPSIGAPGVPATRGTSSVSEAARGVIGDKSATSGEPSNAAVDKHVFGTAVGDDDAQPDPFESGEEPTEEEWDRDRRETRSHELAVPDEYLDPSWPDDASDSAISPEQSDSVENVPLGDDEDMDQAEREDADQYKQALGLSQQPDEFKQDDWGDTPADRTREKDVKEYEDPAEW